MKTLKQYIKDCDGRFCEQVMEFALACCVMSIMVFSLAQL